MNHIHARLFFTLTLASLLAAIIGSISYENRKQHQPFDKEAFASAIKENQTNPCVIRQIKNEHAAFRAISPNDLDRIQLDCQEINALQDQQSLIQLLDG